MKQVTTGTEKTGPRIGQVARNLEHPSGIGLGDDAREVDFSGGQANDEQDVIPNQSLGRPEFHREEIGGGQRLPMSLEELFPRHSLSPLG